MGDSLPSGGCGVGDPLPIDVGTLQAPSGYALDGLLQVLQDGTFLASGQSTDGTKTPVLADYNADGSINASFGVNGTITGNPGTDFQYAYQDSNSGEIVFKQFANQSDGSITEVDNFYTPTGQIDPANSSVTTTIAISTDPFIIDPVVPTDPIVIDPIPVDGGLGWGNSGNSGDINLLSEDFSNVSWQAGTSWENSGVTWNWQLVNGDVAPTEFESYNAAGAPDRGMSATEGGFEVASSGNDGSLWAVTASITLPEGFDPNQSGTISFDAGYRDQVTSGQFGIYDVTQGMDLLTPQQIDGSVGTWTGNQFSVDLSLAAPGDVLELRWLDSASNSCSGLEVGAVNFTAFSAGSPIDGLTAPDGVTLDGDALYLQDGSLLASGWSADGNLTPVLVDYNADGSINTAFGNNGELTGPVRATELWSSQTESGAIQLQGYVDNGDGTSSAFLAQYNSAGQLDTNFGGGSGFLTAPEGESFHGIFQTLADGSILASVISTDGNSTPALVGYSAGGAINTAFGSNGLIYGPEGTDSLSAIDNGDGTVSVSAEVLFSDRTYAIYSAQYDLSENLLADFSPVENWELSDPVPSVVFYDRFDSGVSIADTSVSTGSRDFSPVAASAAGEPDLTSTALFIPQSTDASSVGREGSSGSGSASGLSRDTVDSSGSHESDSLVVSSAFDPSVLGSGIAGISTLKLAASSEGSDRSSQEDGDNASGIIPLEADPLPIPSKQERSAKLQGADVEELSSDPVELDPSSAVATEEELIAALLAES